MPWHMTDLSPCSRMTFRPFNNCLDDCYSWERIIKSINIAVDLRRGENPDTELVEPLNVLSFLACVVEQRHIGGVFKQADLLPCIQKSSHLQNTKFYGSTLIMVYTFLRLEYFMSGRGFSERHPPRDKLVDSLLVDNVSMRFTGKTFLPLILISGICAL
jgi:hypothetical protein